MFDRIAWLKRTAYTHYEIQSWIRSNDCPMSGMGMWCQYMNYAELREATQGE